MITLSSTDSIQAVAGTATAVTSTITGDEINAGVDTFKILDQRQLPTVAASIYTPGGGKTALVKTWLMSNTTGNPVTVTLYLNGTSAANQIGSLLIPANGEAALGSEGWKIYDANGAQLTTISLTSNLITNTSLAQMPAHTYKGNNTGSTANAIDVTATQLAADLPVATTSNPGMMSAADKRQLDGIHYDIVADGGADPTGAVDATSIIATACSTVAAAGGGIVFVPIGTFRVSSTINISGNYVTIRGASRVGSLIRMHTATGDVFNATGTFIRFESLRIQGLNSTLRTADYAINFNTGASNCSAQWVDIIYMWSGVKATGQLCRLEDMNIREMGANAANGQCILIDSFTDQYIRAIVADNPTNPTGFAGIRITNLSSLIITDCQIIHCTNGLDVVPTGTNTIPSIYCANSFFDNGAIGANFVGAAGASIYRCKFNQCWFSSQSTAGVILNKSTLSGVDFINCDFYGSPFGIDAQAARDWTVRASRFAGNTTNAIRTTAAATHSFTIGDNFIGNGAGFGANAQGVNIQAGTYSDYRVINNRGLDSNTTPGIIDAGTLAVASDQKNVSNNMGALVSGLAAATITSPAITTTDTLLVRMPVPANGLQVGSSIRVVVHSSQAASGNPSYRLRFGVNGTTADAALVTHTPTIAAAAQHRFEIVFTPRTLGVSGTCGVVSGNLSTGIADTTTNQTQAVATPTINTTVPNFLSVTVSISASTLTVHSAIIEVLG